MNYSKLKSSVYRSNLLKKLKEQIGSKQKEFIAGLSVLFILCISILGIVLRYLPAQQPSTDKKPAQVKLQKAKKIDAPTYYFVLENERLWDIAEKVYGNPNFYTKLVELNGITNPDSIEKGTKLIIR